MPSDLFPPLRVPADSRQDLMQEMLDVSKLATEVFDSLDAGTITPTMARSLHDIGVRANRVRETLHQAVIDQLPGRHPLAVGRDTGNAHEGAAR